MDDFKAFLVNVIMPTLLFALFIIGCETISPSTPTAGMTAKEKITYYECYYCKNESGFCCRNQVPSYDSDIFNCENAVLFTHGCDQNCEEE